MTDQVGWFTCWEKGKSLFYQTASGSHRHVFSLFYRRGAELVRRRFGQFPHPCFDYKALCIFYEFCSCRFAMNFFLHFRLLRMNMTVDYMSLLILICKFMNTWSTGLIARPNTGTQYLMLAIRQE